MQAVVSGDAPFYAVAEGEKRQSVEDFFSLFNQHIPFCAFRSAGNNISKDGDSTGPSPDRAIHSSLRLPPSN